MTGSEFGGAEAAAIKPEVSGGVRGAMAVIRPANLFCHLAERRHRKIGTPASLENRTSRIRSRDTGTTSPPDNTRDS